MRASLGDPRRSSRRKRRPVAHVDIPEAFSSAAIYAGGGVKGAPYPDAARLWLDFLRSPEGLAIFEHYGFKRYRQAADPKSAGAGESKE